MPARIQSTARLRVAGNSEAIQIGTVKNAFENAYLASLEGPIRVPLTAKFCVFGSVTARGWYRAISISCVTLPKSAGSHHRPYLHWIWSIFRDLHAPRNFAMDIEGPITETGSDSM